MEEFKPVDMDSLSSNPEVNQTCHFLIFQTNSICCEADRIFFPSNCFYVNAKLFFDTLLTEVKRGATGK